MSSGGRRRRGAVAAMLEVRGRADEVLVAGWGMVKFRR